MAKKIIIDVEVNSESIDQAVAKTGELKKLSDRISIQYDIDGRPLDVVINKSLNLQQQVKALTAELRKTKEGTAEFQLLSSRLGEAQDGLAKTTAKSKDLFSSLSLLPGPIGQFFSQLQGGIELLKTFSSFTFKDLQFQFKETADDIADIGKNLSGIGGDKIDDIAESAEKLSDSLSDVDTKGLEDVSKSADEATDSLSQAATQGGTTSASIRNLSSEFSTLDNNFLNASLNSRQLRDALMNLRKSGYEATIEAVEDLNGVSTDSKIVVKDLNGETVTLSNNQIKAASTTKGMITGLDQLVFAEKTATFWTTTLGKTIQGVLIGTGIGLAIVVIGELIAMFYKMITSEEEAETATRSLTAAFEEQQRVLQNDLDAIDASNKAMQTRAKIAGKTEAEINEIVKSGGKERLELLRQFDKQLYKDQDDVTKNTVMKAEDKEKLLKDINDKILKNGQDITKQILTNEQTTLDQQLSIAEKRRAKQKEINDRIAQENRQHQEKIKQDNKTADDALFQLLQENTTLKLKTEREREDQELKNAKENEEKKIKALEISENRKGEILNQIAWKYYYKNQEMTKKRKEEDIASNQELVNKLADITIASYREGADRDVAAREEKYKRDRDALNADINFIKMSEEAKAFYREQMVKAKEDDIIKIKSDARIKELDTELRFLEMTNEANKNSFKAYWDGRQKFLDLSKQRELAALDLTEAQKLAIEKKYNQLSKDLQREKLNAYLGYLSQGLSAVQNAMSQQSQIVNLQQGNELDSIQIRYNKEKDIITKSNKSKEEQDKELLKSKEAFEREQDKVKEKYFYKNRDAQKAQAMISAFQSAIAAYSSLAAIPVVGPFLGAAAAAVALAFGIKQANLIGQQQYVGSDFSGYNQPAAGAAATSAATTTAPTPNYGRNYADGGMIGGNRHSDGGTIIEAERGEAIMTRGAVTMFQPMLSMMNQMGGGTSFAPSLVSTSYDNPKVSNPSQEDRPMIIKSYVVAGELTSEANKQARLKDLSTI